MVVIRDTITYKAEKTATGDILVIYRGDEPIGNLRQIGKGKSPDVELRSSYIEKPMRFPMVSLGDISQRDVEKIVEKYITKPKAEVNVIQQTIDRIEKELSKVEDLRSRMLKDKTLTEESRKTRNEFYDASEKRLKKDLSYWQGQLTKPSIVEKARVGRGEAEARYKELMKPRLEAHDREIKAVNDDFMAGKMSLKEMNEKHKAIHKKTDALATTMRKRVWGEYPETLPSQADLEKIQRMRSPRSQASDLARQHSVVIGADSPKVAKWLHDQGTADIERIDTPPISKRGSKISRKTPRITPRVGRLK